MLLPHSFAPKTRRKQFQRLAGRRSPSVHAQLFKSGKKRGDYEVGYGKPPPHSRYVPGESGNKGRKKKPSETSAQIVARVRDEIVTVNGKRMPMFELAVYSTMTNTIKRGHPRELKAMFDLLDKYGAMPEGDKHAEARAGAETVMQKIMEAFDRTHDLDPEDSAAINRLGKEEARMVIGCRTCGPELRRQWHTPDRRALADRGRKTSLQSEAEMLKTKTRGVQSDV